MAYEGEAIDAALSVAAGNDPALFMELRVAFVTSAERQLDLLGRARCDANWEVAAMRLKGLAASFNAHGLITLADEAANTVPGDRAVLRRIRRFIDDLTLTV